MSQIDLKSVGVAVVAAASFALASCSAAPTESVASLPPPDLSRPMTMADMQSGIASTDVDRYRPSQRLPACNLRPLSATATPSNPEFAQALEDAAAYSREANGVGIIVLHNGAVVHRSYADGLNGSTQFVSASMMKTVNALLTGIAIEQGLIGSVDDPVGQYLAEWENDPRGEITLRQLLTMSSGLKPLGFAQFLFAPDGNAAALGMERIEAPDSTFYYNNAVSQLVGAVVDQQARRAGRTGYAQYLYEELWCQLGNGDALLWTDEAGMPRSYAGLHAGFDDWARIGELIRLDGRVASQQVVSADWIAEMVRPSATNDQYGLQVWRSGTWTERRSYNPDNPIKIYHSAPFAADDLVYLDGFGGQRVYIVPSKGLTIVRGGEVNLEFDDARIPNGLINALD